MIFLKSEHLKAIREHGEADYPHECCGLLIGRFGAQGEKRVEETSPISNAREEEAKRNRFLITPEELLAGEKLARQKKLDVVGFYHSHPDHPAVASRFDLEHAWPVYSYVIVSINQGESGDLLSWEMEEDRSRFYPEQILEGE
jgi:proteasome lid subunit RPN8/RPN11